MPEWDGEHTYLFSVVSRARVHLAARVERTLPSGLGSMLARYKRPTLIRGRRLS
jgi:hypothetical protein